MTNIPKFMVVNAYSAALDELEQLQDAFDFEQDPVKRTQIYEQLREQKQIVLEWNGILDGYEYEHEHIKYSV